ncbi:MAG: hypothetical protein Q8R43_03460 [Alphaproteobacteria bacterium]|nr:hypothetical protein [Alphaproteobacteria bacterium]
MKSIISISFGFGLLISHTCARATDLMEGAVGEAEASARFFAEEANSAVTEVEQAMVALNLTIQDSTSSIEVQEQQSAALTNLKAKIDALAFLLPLLADSRSQAKKMRKMLEARPQDSDNRSATE